VVGGDGPAGRAERPRENGRPPDGHDVIRDYLRAEAAPERLRAGRYATRPGCCQAVLSGIPGTFPVISGGGAGEDTSSGSAVSPALIAASSRSYIRAVARPASPIDSCGAW
jgi:hypothetical protein